MIDKIIKLIVAKKLVIILLVGIIAFVGLLSLFSGKGGFGSGPEATVKAFFKAINEGNFIVAKGYLAGDSFLNSISSMSRVPASFDEPDKAGLTLLIDNIDKVEVLKENSDSHFAMLTVGVTFKAGLKEKAEKLMEEYSHASPFVRNEKAEEDWHRGIFLRNFVNKFQDGGRFELAKWKDGWKIEHP